MCTLKDGCTKHRAVAMALAVNGPETPGNDNFFSKHISCFIVITMKLIRIIRTCTREEFKNIRCQSERYWPVGIQLTGRVIDIELEVSNVDETRVLMHVHHVWV